MDFLGLFPWKNRRKKSTKKKSTAKFKSEFGSFAAKIHTAGIWPRVIWGTDYPAITQMNSLGEFRGVKIALMRHALARTWGVML